MTDPATFTRTAAAMVAANDARVPEQREACDVYVVEGPGGFTESFNRHTIDVLERLGLIRHCRDDHVLQDGSGRGVGPLHRFYGPAVQ